MSLTTTSTLIGLPAAALVAWALGGALGWGAIAGFLAGASVTAFGVARQRRALRAEPARALRALVEGFLIKLAAIVLFGIVLVTVAPLRERIDPRSFLLAFGAAVLVVLLPGTIENARILRERSAE